MVDEAPGPGGPRRRLADDVAGRGSSSAKPGRDRRGPDSPTMLCDVADVRCRARPRGRASALLPDHPARAPIDTGVLRAFDPRQGPSHRRGPDPQEAVRHRRPGEQARARLRGSHRRGAAGGDRPLQGAPRGGRDPRRPAPRGVRRGARGVAAHARPAALRRPAHGRCGAAPRQHRRDEDR
ncbi:Uncharacterised protein [Mycobacteroides abscessus]|nr:Uncharacterised protein [Mycobacteroides abscessus]